ncbi:MAG TPA: hypothetical protein VD815_06625 [Candidatus Saccharimonadales bacterium]|nr:hypothetical protein [Candidatus Saccharimonadales bacterium]
MLSKKEKEALIIKLLLEGRTNREICKIARCSPNEITPIRKRITGEDADIDIDMKGKSICAQLFDLLEKGTALSQIIVKIDVDPEEAMRLEDKYLHVLKRDKIIHLLKDQKNMTLILDILEFLISNPDLWKKIKEIENLQTIIRNLMADRGEIEHDIEVNKTLLIHYDGQVEEMERQLGLPRRL